MRSWVQWIEAWLLKHGIPNRFAPNEQMAVHGRVWTFDGNLVRKSQILYIQNTSLTEARVGSFKPSRTRMPRYRIATWCTLNLSSIDTYQGYPNDYHRQSAPKSARASVGGSCVGDAMRWNPICFVHLVKLMNFLRHKSDGEQNLLVKCRTSQSEMAWSLCVWNG